ncbi:hypothetical protein GCM10009798_39300 [Nocardioides panacihumi]|uniref:Peptidase C14 caspase domain-containing protein n=1 Tax=Nocardioides panacihumi TaxID=400774 RepID=A0ABN2RSL1_9ACTN
MAVTDYLDTSLRALRAPAGDAAELRDLLADPEVGGFSVTSVVNERAHQLRVAIEDFLADREPDDLLLVYLSCHGLVDARRRLYFAARDTFKNRLASSGVESHWLLDQLEDCRARRQVVILDCCFSGAFARGAKGDDDMNLGEHLVGEGRGRVVLTASRGSEYSFEGEPLQGDDAARGSVFTSALIDGIRTGRADTDHDGEISVEDAYAYAFEQVRRSGTQQTPQRWLYGAEGSILLARTPPVLTPAEPPAPPPAEPAPVPLPSGTDGPADAPPVPPSPAPPSRARRWRRPSVLAAIGVGVAAVAGLVVFLVLQGGDPGSPGGGGDGTAGISTSGTITQSSPWRLRIKDDISNVSGGDDVGCSITLGNRGSGNVRSWDDFYGVKTFQMRESGTFDYHVSDRGCLLLPQRGDGGVAPLPLLWSSADGDSAVFESPGRVTVSVTDFQGTPTCDLFLMADADGRAVDNREASDKQASVTLESDGPRRVFVKAPTCSIRVVAAP